MFHNDFVRRMEISRGSGSVPVPLSVYFKKPHENDFFHLSREKIEDVPNSTWFGTELRFLSSISVIDSGSMLGTGSALEHSQESSSELTLSEVKNS